MLILGWFCRIVVGNIPMSVLCILTFKKSLFIAFSIENKPVDVNVEYQFYFQISIYLPLNS